MMTLHIMNYSMFGKLKELWFSVVYHTRKNSHLAFYVRKFSLYMMPDCLWRLTLPGVLKSFERLSEDEKQYVLQRVNYYCKFNEDIHLPEDAQPLSAFSFRERTSYVHDYVNSTYFFDAYDYVRYFPKSYRWAYNPGDVFYLFPVPEITKSRPLMSGNENRNNILLNLDRVRHFVWVHDPFRWEQKECRILFRGAAKDKPRRIRFLELWSQHPLCDLADTGDMTIYDHLRYKYIMSLEGNDVASNLKWVMSSNSVAVMPKPTCETWYMEGRLIPNYHYIEIADDYHDLIDRVMYYEQHPDEAKEIVRHAHEWVAQFRNKKREKLISLMVLDKYFTLTGQRGFKEQGARYYLVNDLVRLNTIQKANAQGKARQDVVTTLESVGYKVYNIENIKYSWGKSKPYHHYPFITKYVAKRQARQLIDNVKADDIVLIQDFQLEHMRYIADECLAKRAKVVFLVHDIQCIRYNITTDEVAWLNKASVVLAHTQAMADKLQEIGVTVPVKVLTIFDYYSADPMQPAARTLKLKDEIVFAGNLTKSKFLKDLTEDKTNSGITFRLYGVLKGLDLADNASFRYCGVFKPHKTSNITGGWGLIWDGDSIDSCTGEYGDYLRYNSSHKTSLYLACGLPIIAWEKSALARWIEENKLGIVVPNLHSLDERIAAVSDEEYAAMTANAQAMGNRLRRGYYLKKAMKDI